MKYASESMKKKKEICEPMENREGGVDKQDLLKGSH